MAYKHVDESRKGDDYVIGHKRLQIDGAKAGFMGICGLLGAVFMWQVFHELSEIGGAFEYLAYVGLAVGILWALFAVIESSTIYYSEEPCFSTKSVKLIYWVLFISTLMNFAVSGPSRTKYGKLYAVIEVAIISVLLYLLYKVVVKALRAKKKNRTKRGKRY